MAEALGTVAAALQLAETAWKLKKLCSDILNAPKDLSDLVEEVVALADLLADSEQYYTGRCQTVADTNSWNRCRELLKNSVTAMQDVTSELESALKTNKLTGRIRVHLKRDELTKWSARMERVKTTMIAAQQSYSFAMLTQQNALMLKEIRSIAIDQQAASHAAQTNTTTAISAQSSSITCTVSDAGLSGSCSTVGSRRRTQQTVQTRRSRVYNIRMPSWIYRKGLNILIESSNTSWGATLQTYNRLPTDAEVFDFARHGKWDDVRILFDTGRASLFDVAVTDHRDEDLLKIAVSKMDYRGCEFLLKYSTECSQPWRFDWKWILLFSFKVFWAQRRKDPENTASFLSVFKKIFALIVPVVQESFSYDAEPTESVGCMMIQYLPAECARLMADELFHSYEAVEAVQRARKAMDTLSLDAQTVLTVVGRDQTLHQAFELLSASGSHSSHRTLFASIAEKIGLLYSSADPESAAVQAWISILSEVVSFETTTSAMLPFFSGLWAFLSGRSNMEKLGPNAFMTSNQIWTAEAKIWIQILSDVGVDLELYGRAESQCLLNREQCSLDEDEQKGHPMCYPDGATARFRPGYMTYGPEVDDWAIWIVPLNSEHYEMAGAFWNSIENPELFDIPGAFGATDEEEPEFYLFMGGWIGAPCM